MTSILGSYLSIQKLLGHLLGVAACTFTTLFQLHGQELSSQTLGLLCHCCPASDSLLSAPWTISHYLLYSHFVTELTGMSHGTVIQADTSISASCCIGWATTGKVLGCTVRLYMSDGCDGWTDSCMGCRCTPGVKHPDNSPHVLGSTNGRQASNTPTNDQHLGRGHPACSCDLASEESTKLIGCLNDCPAKACLKSESCPARHLAGWL